MKPRHEVLAALRRCADRRASQQLPEIDLDAIANGLSDTGYGSAKQFHEALAKSDSLAPVQPPLDWSDRAYRVGEFEVWRSGFTHGIGFSVLVLLIVVVWRACT